MGSERCLISTKTIDHGGEQGLRIERLKTKGMAGLARDELCKGKLRAAVALTEGMNGIQLGEDMSKLRHKPIGVQIAESILSFQALEQTR